MHGCGNDYIYINTMKYVIPNPSEAARLWSDRHKGIGSVGLVLIGGSTIPEADFSMRIFNADGSEAMMCGNASRCIGKYLYERGLTKQTEIRLLTLSGIKALSLHIKDDLVESVTVDMLEPVLEEESQFIPSRGLTHITSSSPTMWIRCARKALPWNSIWPSHNAVTSSLPMCWRTAASVPGYGNGAAASPRPVAREPVQRQWQPS